MRRSQLINNEFYLLFYSIVLIIPILIAFLTKPFLVSMFGRNWWVVPLCMATVFATAGSIIFLYLQRKIEDNLSKEQRKYQETLRRASLGMGQVRDLKKLLKLIVHVVTRTIKIKYCKIYLYHKASDKYVLKASRGILSAGSQLNDVILAKSQLVEYLMKEKDPVFFNLIKDCMNGRGSSNLMLFNEKISSLNNALVLPCFIENKLIAIFILGDKRSGERYSYEDMSLFAILANQSALAIENAEFYEDMKKMLEQLFKAEKMATIGTMAGGLSHQINNRLHAIGFIAGDAVDSINIRKQKDTDRRSGEVLADIKESFLRIEDNVKRGGEIVGGLLKYSVVDSEVFEPVDLNKILDSAIEMVKFKIKLKEINIVRTLDDDMPLLKGNFAQLQEAFFNIIDNSNDSMAQKKHDIGDPSYVPRIDISAHKTGRSVEVIFKDNGMGVKKEDKGKLFTAFFTTKVADKKGTGLGLFVIKQIIEENHKGKISFLSEYGEGAETRILLASA